MSIWGNLALCLRSLLIRDESTDDLVVLVLHHIQKRDLHTVPQLGADVARAAPVPMLTRCPLTPD